MKSKSPKSVALFVSAFAFLGIGCGGDKAARKNAEGGPEFALAHRKAPKPVDPGAWMTLDNEIGVMDTDDVEATLQDHFDDVRACYTRAGKAQRYAGGKVLLRFMVAGDGASQDVWVLESTLGDSVERCLVEVGRKIRFHAPHGNKATTFEYSVEFRSESGMEILEIGMVTKVNRDLATLMPQLAACGQIASEQVNAMIYIESNGVLGSVGLATAAAGDRRRRRRLRGPSPSAAGACRWAFPAMSCARNFGFPPTVATAEASPHRTLTHHRRR